MPSSLPCPALAGLHVLLVDPDADTRELLAYVFEDCGAFTRAAADPGEASTVLDTFAPDVVVANLGAATGRYTFIHALRARKPNVLTVALTGHAAERDHARALAEGFDVHLSKPINIEATLALIGTKLAALGREPHAPST